MVLGDRSMSATSLVEVLPVAHLAYALVAIEYFDDILRSDDSADLASDEYLVGHARFRMTMTGDAALSTRSPEETRECRFCGAPATIELFAGYWLCCPCSDRLGREPMTLCGNDPACTRR